MYIHFSLYNLHDPYTAVKGNPYEKKHTCKHLGNNVILTFKDRRANLQHRDEILLGLNHLDSI
jgi:hypothetical protein